MFTFTDKQASTLSDIIALACTDIMSADVWTDILRLVNALVPADASAAIFFDQDTGKPVKYANHGFDPKLYQAYEQYYHTREPILPKALAQGTFTWRPQDMAPDKVWRNTELYTDFLSANGLRDFVTSAIPFGSGASVWMRLARTSEEVPFTGEDVQMLQFIQPHLSSAYRNAASIKAREAVRSAVLSSFERTQNAVFIFDQDIALVHMNPSAKAICSTAEVSFDEVVSRLTRAAQNILRSEKHPFYSHGGHAEATLLAGGRRYVLAGFPIEPAGSPPYYAVFAADVMMHLTMAYRRSMQAYGLSPREMEVCESLIRGLSNREIADALCVTELTIKDHVKSIREKLRVTSRSKILLKLLSF